MSHPDRMRVALTTTPGEAVIDVRPVPALGPGDALVKTAVVGVCAGDTAPWYVAKKVPCVLGHEPAGTVVAVGADVTSVKPGDRVFFHHHAPCLACDDCRAGRHTLCRTWRTSRLDPGGLAEYVRVPKENLLDTIVLPDDVPFEDAALVEPLACCVKAARRVALKPGESVLVIGLGSMGLMLAALARGMGAHPVIGTDFNAYRRSRAAETCCDVVIDAAAPDVADQIRAANRGRLCDVVMVGPGDPRALQAGIDLCQAGGRWTCFWPLPAGQTLPIDTHDLYFREITLHFSYSCGPDDTREALSWIRKGTVRAKDLVTHRFPLERTAEAFAVTRAAGDSIKALVIVDPEQA